MKNGDKFDQEAKLTSPSLAKEEVLLELSEETKSYIETNYGSLEEFVTMQIEATDDLLK